MRFRLLGAAFVFFMVTVTSCKKDPFISSGFLDDSQLGLITTDTFFIKGSTVKVDSLSTSSRSVGIIGSYVDPVFGYADAGLFTEVVLSSSNVDFGNLSELTADSVVLTLPYSGYYGKLTTQSFKVYELTENLSATTTYYSNQKVGYNSTEVGSVTLIPNVSNSQVISGSTWPAHLRISLDLSVANKLLNAGTTVYSSNTEFVNFFKGLYIRPSHSDANDPSFNQLSGEGALLYFDLTSDYSKLSLYYTRTTVDTTTHHIFDYPINSTASKFNTFSHNNYEGTDIQTVAGSYSGGEELLYMQSGAGSIVKLLIQGLNTFNQGKPAIINRAELILPVNTTLIGDYEPHDQIILTKINADETVSDVPDILEGLEHFGGAYNSVDGEIKFNITRYLQSVSNGEKHLGFFIFPEKSVTEGNRTIFYGTQNQTESIKLVVSYTPIK